MTPQEIAKSIADELRQHPERWAQGANGYSADGNAVTSRSQNAVCWCLIGHIRRRDPDGRVPRELRSALMRETGFRVVADWNDKQGRTVAEVIALCDKVSQS